MSHISLLIAKVTNSLNLFVFNFYFIWFTVYLFLIVSDIIYIFVVSFGKNTVEKFRFDEKRQTLNHVQTYHDPTFTRSAMLNVTLVLLYIK